MNRRQFLCQSAATAATCAGFPYFVRAAAGSAGTRPSANDRPRLGVIGLGPRACQLITSEKMGALADIVAAADCYLKRFKDASETIPDVAKWTTYQDYRRMLEREKLDAVLVATTTHARALACIHAMQAGLDVYAEKPISLTIAEGRALARAVAKYNRVFQAGTQQRSLPPNAWACEHIRRGLIGPVRHAITCNFQGPYTWAAKEPQPMPDGLDWDVWCNQTELRPYHDALHIQWQLWWDYDGGGASYGVTGWGTHALDQAQNALNKDATGPVAIEPASASPDAPVTLRYGDGTEIRTTGPRNGFDALGTTIVGDKGRIKIRRGSCEADHPELLEGIPPDGPCVAPGETVDHIRNFFDCMRTREKPHANVETAHRATTLCHLINIARRLGRSLKWDPAKECFVGDEEANAARARPRRKGYELPAEFA